ncbi:MAG: methylated-DNA--[protein]-cysteine S-methyltransferase [Clostridia bacterium]|nr:methylated-DNA--[protein]-cysteine S-methyltransferase [Clostridia bacterium]
MTEHFSASGFDFTIKSDGRAVTEIKRGMFGENTPDDVTSLAVKELTEYFDGKRTCFSFPVEYHSTPFREKVWNALRRIPYGHTVTYGELAEMIGEPSAARAVGNAVGDNPLLIVLPCHRVTAKGAIGGFSAGLDLKKALMQIEKIL